MSTLKNIHHVYAFAGCMLDVSRGTLSCGEQERKLRPKSHAVLRYLVEHAGCLVSKPDLLEAVWGEVIVSDDSITQCLIEIRRALGDRQMQIIRTVPRRGYVFDVAVEVLDFHVPGQSDDSASDLSDPIGAAVHTRNRFSGHPATRWAIALCLVLIASFLQWRLWAPPTIPAQAEATAMQHSIAVLPFADLSPQGDQGYLADGLAEEIINLLAAMHEIDVIARTSSFSFRGKQVDVATVAAQLRVSHVLEGSVRRVNDRVRINAQLIETSGSTQVWSQAYEGDFDDAFQLQDEIAAAVADALQLQIAQSDVSRPTISAKARENYLHGRYLYDRRSRGDLARARDYFQAALDQDPAYAQAWAALAASYGALISVGALDSEQAEPLQLQAIRRALVLDPELIEAHVYACFAMSAQGDWKAAEEHHRRALAAGPNNPLVLATSAGFSAWRGDYESAILLSRRALSVDPIMAVNRYNLGQYLISAGRYAEARKELARVVDLQPNPISDPRLALVTMFLLERRSSEALDLLQTMPASPFRDRGMALASHALGQSAQAQLALQQLLEADTVESHIRLAEVFTFRGEHDRAFMHIGSARALLPVDSKLGSDRQLRWELHASPFFIPLRSDPRWTKSMAIHDRVARTSTSGRPQS